MSSLADPHPDPPAADELVAYLDGELPPQDCRRVESRLATDEDYRQQMHELDRAWEALDVLPTPTVDDGFARTTIELACVAAEADLTEHTAIAKAARRNRVRRWIAAGIAAAMFGFFAAHALVPNRNEELVADLPAIQQFNVLPYVGDVEFLRQLATAVQPAQLRRDEPAFDRDLKELDYVNSESLETRREWIQQLQPEQKAQVADRARAFRNLEPSPEEQERMRTVMAEIRGDPKAETLQKTLIAYGQWLSRISIGQKQQLREDFRTRSPQEQAALVAKMIRREEGQPWQHLSADDANALRDAILNFAIDKDKKAAFSQKMLRNHRAEFLRKLEANPLAHAVAILYSELLEDKQFEPIANQLVEKLSSDAQAHWKSLERKPRDLRKPQFGFWVREAIRPKLDPEELERFFASDELSNDERQRLLDMPRPEMEAALKRQYLGSGLGVEAGQLLREFGEPGRMPRNGPGTGGPQWRPEGPWPDGRAPGRLGSGRPGGGPDGRRDNRPNERRPPNRPPQSSPDQPPPKTQKPEAI